MNDNQQNKSEDSKNIEMLKVEDFEGEVKIQSSLLNNNMDTKEKKFFTFDKNKDVMIPQKYKSLTSQEDARVAYTYASKKIKM